MRRLLALLVLPFLLLAACSDDEPEAAPTTTTSTTEAAADADAEVLEILVSNDDGIGAEGIDAVVEALRAEPDTEVTVVAPAENQSGQGENTTTGELVVTEATTASGFEGTAVAGRPADSVIHALEVMELTPHVLVSGTNEGQNIGPFSGVSGTVGAAKAAARRGIPALAVSTGIAEGVEPDHDVAAELAVEWIREHREALLAGEEPVAVTSINVPSCTTGELRGELEVDLATDFRDRSASTMDCASTKPEAELVDDVDAFTNGYASITPVPLGEAPAPTPAG